MPEVEIREATGLLGRRLFVDIPFRIHGGNPNWIPPLRLSVYDRLSPRHPAMAHQEIALWVAYRNGKPAGRIGACIDSLFDEYQKVKWGWIGFYDSFDDDEVAKALFDTACGWTGRRGADTCVGPANFTTNDELGLLVEGFDSPASVLTLENPPYYERLWTGHGWEQAMDLWGWELGRATVFSERQRRALDRIQKRARVTARGINMADFDAEVGRFFEVYNAAWSYNWGFAPLPEAEIRHVAKQLRQIINPNWAFGLETADGTPVAVCLALPDVNRLMARVRTGRLLPTGWYPLLTGRRTLDRARIWALGVRPDYQHLALGPLLYREIADRLTADPYFQIAEASWTLATNHRINNQLEAMGARRTKVWRLYQRPARSSPAA
jgi:ribosomal protein S18 acetylase RimI-like enzyme